MTIPEEALTARDFMQIRAELVRAVGGANEALVVSRIHYRAHAEWHEAHEKDGSWWWPASYERIAEDTGLTRDQVKRALRSLIDGGHVVGEKHQLGGSYDRTVSYRVISRPIDRAKSPDEDRAKSPDVLLSQEVKEEQGEREEEFDKIWAMWPRKVGKPAAQKAYASAAKRAKPEVIAAGVTAALQFFARERTEIRFVPHLSTWLNQNRWEDELTPTNQPVAPVEGSGPRLAPDEKLIDGIIWRRGRPRLGGQYGMTVAQYQEWQAEQQRLIQEARDRRG